MKTIIDIDNYEEIMFRLLEDDFDQPTRTDLLEQIEADELFKFEWESWQKTKVQDPLENYADESCELTDNILLIAEPKPAKRKLIFYFLAAASIIVMLGALFLLNADFRPGLKQSVIVKVTNHQTSGKQTITEVQNAKGHQVRIKRKQFQKPNCSNEALPIISDSIFITPVSTTLAEIPPVIDSVAVKINELAKALNKNPRYKVTIETILLSDFNSPMIDLAQNRKGKLGKVLTNTKLLFQRKPNGEPNRIILFGEDNSYLCINLNY